MKKILPIFILASSLVIPMTGLAQGLEKKCSDFTFSDTCVSNGCFWNEAETPGKCAGVLIKEAGDVIDVINKVGNWIFVFLMAVSALFLVFAGFLWVTAGGNPENIKKAQTMLINSIIGLAIGLGARGIVTVIKSVIAG